MCLALIVSWPGFLQTASDLQVDLSAFAVSCRRSLTSDGLGGSRPEYRELGKHPRTAPFRLMLQLGGRGHEPWLSVDDRCERCVGHVGGTAPARTRLARAWQRWSPARAMGEARHGDHLPRWQAPEGCAADWSWIVSSGAVGWIVTPLV
jgi:hypothetical protein